VSKATRTNAVSIGKNDATSDALAAEIRKLWLKATPDAKAEMAAEYKVGYIAGRERISLSDAQAIFDAGKGKGVAKKHIAMIDCAVSSWNYRIVNGKSKKAKKAKPAEPALQPRISSALRSSAMDFLANFKGKSLEEQIEQALVILNALK
jgi:hypothetical protein